MSIAALADASSRQLQLERADFAGREVSSEAGGHYGYWRKADGDIVICGMGAHEVQANLESEWQLLPKYGRFTLTVSKRQQWDPSQDPYLLILAQGGIKEFTLRQIMEHRWHARPHAILKTAIDGLKAQGIPERDALDMVIPQLKGQEWEIQYCKLCPGREFNDEDQLTRHNVIHKELQKDQQLATAITKGLSDAQSGNLEALRPLLEQNGAIMELLTRLLTTQASTSGMTAVPAEIVADVPAESSGKPKK